MDEVRLIDANALHKRIEMNLRASNPFTIEECCYKDALNSVDDAPTIDPETLQPTWRNPETDPPKVETEVLILYRNDIDGYSITTAHYEDGSVFLQDSVWYWEDLPIGGHTTRSGTTTKSRKAGGNTAISTRTTFTTTR